MSFHDPMARSEQLLSLAEVACLEEARVALGVGEVAPERMPFGGGVASRDAPGAWTNAAIGAGLHGPVSHDEVRRMIEWYRSVGVEPRAEVSPYAHPSLIEHLGAEHFVIRFFENVFMRPIQRGEQFQPPVAAPEDVEIREVNPADPSMVDSFARVVSGGFAGDGNPILEASIDVVRRVARHPRTTSIVAIRNGEIVGGGSMEVSGQIAACFGLAIRSEHRRVGIQQAMLAWRLRYAAERGAKFVTISSRPNVATERNARRMGFVVAYTKVILVRPGPGLAPVAE
jgi:GNAT superfamily N-acetyltransferase